MVCEELGGNSLWCRLLCYIPLGVGEELENEAAFKKKKAKASIRVYRCLEGCSFAYVQTPQWEAGCSIRC